MSIWDSFPVLGPGNEIHLTPRGGTLFVRLFPCDLSTELADFLAVCDGTRRLADIVPSSWSDRFGEIKFLMLISRLVDQGDLMLSAEPSFRRLRITGSRSAYIPPHMSIELTAGCNLRCRHCYRESEIAKNGYMPTDALLRILQHLREAGLRSVELTGGEPLLHKDFLSIIEYCGNSFELVGTLTNGTILTQKICDKFASLGERLLLSISLDASTAEEHDRRRGARGSFARTTRNIERLSALGLRVRVSMSVDEESFQDVENTLLLARRLGASAFSYAPVLPLGRGKDWAAPGWRLDGREVMRAEGELAERYRGFLTVLPEEKQCDLEDGEGCGAGYRTYTMDPWGSVRPCAMYNPDEIVIGNLREQGVEEVFGHPLTRALAEFPVPGPNTCAGCRLELFCRYCGLRGLRGSQMVTDCRWARQPTVQAVLAYWKGRERGAMALS